MAKVAFMIVGALALLYAGSVHSAAKSNIHEIYAAVVFGVGIVSIGFALILGLIEGAVTTLAEGLRQVSASVTEEANEDRRRGSLKRCQVCHADNNIAAIVCNQCGQAF